MYFVFFHMPLAMSVSTDTFVLVWDISPPLRRIYGKYVHYFIIIEQSFFLIVHLPTGVL